MDKLEKVERLREKANVSYEEARAALEETGGDLLDAMVLLEKMGRVKAPGQSTYSTEYDEQREYLRVKETVEEQEKAAPSVGRTLGRVFRGIVRFIRGTSFIVSRREETVFTMPTWVFALLLFLFWELLAPVMIIALFFEVRYSFEGTKDAETANSILSKAGRFAEDVKNEFRTDDPSRDESGSRSEPAGGRED